MDLYNRRGEDCENRIKECGSDLPGRNIPSSELGPNRILVAINTVAHNLLMLMRRMLFVGSGWRPCLKLFRLAICLIP